MPVTHNAHGTIPLCYEQLLIRKNTGAYGSGEWGTTLGREREAEGGGDNNTASATTPMSTWL